MGGPSSSACTPMSSCLPTFDASFGSATVNEATPGVVTTFDPRGAREKRLLYRMMTPAVFARVRRPAVKSVVD